MRVIRPGTLLSFIGTLKEPNNNRVDTNTAPPTTLLSDPNPTKEQPTKKSPSHQKIILLYIKGEKNF